MKCPRCEVAELTIANGTGVEIGYSTKGRGTWLDHSENDVFISRAEPYPFELVSEKMQAHNKHGRVRQQKRSGYLKELVVN